MAFYSLLHKKALASGIASQNHNQRACANQEASNDGLGRELFVEKHRRHHQRDDHAEFVDGHHLGHLANLDGAVVAQPRRAGGQPGQDEEQPAFPADLRDAALGVGEEHHAPGHGHHHHGADGGGQVGVDAVDPHLGQDGGECGKYGGQKGKNKPHNDHSYEVSAHSVARWRLHDNPRRPRKVFSSGIFCDKMSMKFYRRKDAQQL